MKNIRFNDGSLEVEFAPGEWGQFAHFSKSSWTFPDGGRNKALAGAADGLLADMVAAYREKADNDLAAALLGVADGESQWWIQEQAPDGSFYNSVGLSGGTTAAEAVERAASWQASFPHRVVRLAQITTTPVAENLAGKTAANHVNSERAAAETLAQAAEALLKHFTSLPGRNATTWPYPPEFAQVTRAIDAWKAVAK